MSPALSVIVSVLLFLTGVAKAVPVATKTTSGEVRQMLEDELRMREQVFEMRTREALESKSYLPNGESCNGNEDCPTGSVCMDMRATVERYVTGAGGSDHATADRISRKLEAKASECWHDPYASMEREFARSYVRESLDGSLARIDDAYSQLESGRVWIHRPRELLHHQQLLATLSSFHTPEGSGHDELVLASRGNSPDLFNVYQLLPVSILNAARHKPGSAATGGRGSVADRLISNPFLYYSLMNSNDTENVKTLLLLSVLSSALGSTSSSASSSELLIAPLLLRSMMDDEESSRSDLLPIFYMEGSPSHQLDPASPVCAVTLLLLMDADNMELIDLLPVILLASSPSPSDHLLPLLLTSDPIRSAALRNPLLLISLLRLDLDHDPVAVEITRSDDVIGVLRKEVERRAASDPVIESLLPVLEESDPVIGFLLSQRNDSELERLIPILMSEDASLVRLSDLLLASELSVAGDDVTTDLQLPLLVSTMMTSWGVESNVLLMTTLLSKIDGRSGGVSVDGNGVNISPRSPLNYLLPMMLLERNPSSNFSDLLLLTYFESQRLREDGTESGRGGNGKEIPHGDAPL